ncbi:DNA-binding CsgD family transcriptional regulator/sugar-specific transcriptional regulator TrmB [Streptacidiphilus sp. BW17]|uniref:LuxR C-terminal-related transcriptional regulator n=1 Tax=Streptacidiphilus sp. BW17 TaxID=3156274 RepID=UPI0035193097
MPTAPGLAALGLEPEQERLYRLLLTRPDTRLDALPTALGLPRPQVDAIVERLVELSLLSWSGGSGRAGGELRPVSPGPALHALLAERQAQAARDQRDLAQARDSIEELVADVSAAAAERGPAAPAEYVLGADSVRVRVEQLAAQARREVLTLAPRVRLGPTVDGLLRRGVTVRTVYLDSVVNDPAKRAHAEHLVSLGAQVRTAPVLPLRLQLLDGEVAVVPADPAEPGRGAALVREPGAVAGLRELFQTVWRAALPFGADVPVRNDDLVTPEERALLDLLAQGLTDEAAARRLGVSLRTERRLITELMRRLEVSSRFQLGLRAARLDPSGSAD